MSQDVEFAGKISQFMRRFPEEWQEYQDWLPEILASRSVLMARYPLWQVRLILRWRLLYFAGYVVRNIALNRLKNIVGNQSLSKIGKKMTQSITTHRARYILQRIATLLAVTELTLCGIAAITGILLAFYYQPTAAGAHPSLVAIINEVTNGTLVLSLHNIAGNGLILVALVQLVVLFFGREFLLSWFAGWMSGILLTLTAIGLSWTAIVLTWEQTSFWRFKIELSIVGSIPIVGPFLREILAGGSGITSVTLQHMYALHSYILAIAAIGFSIAHLVALICQEQNWKPLESQWSLKKG